jgi:release factor glutamine methyltransferase
MNPRDVDLLLCDVSGRSLPSLIAHGETEIDAGALEAMLQRRHAGEPLQYIRGTTEFYSRPFRVDDRVLIPRPETELLVEAALARLAPAARVVDVGAGSGCISVTLALERADLRVMAVDRSVAALAVARANRDALGARVSLLASDVLSSFRGAVDAVISNPPYIPRADVAELAVEVRDHEPHLALTPGPRGTEIIERLFDEARSFGARQLLMEIGYGQADEIRALASSKRWSIDELLNDLAGIPRIVISSPA